MAETFMDKIFDTFDFGEEDKVTTAINIGEYEVASGGDTMVGQRNFKVCLDCVSKIMGGAEIPMPKTSDIDTFMGAMVGYKVSLYEFNDNDMKWTPSAPKVWKDRDQFKVIDNAGDIAPGDIMIVEAHNGNYHGKHATLVSNVSGGVDDKGFFRGFFSGVDVIHDMGEEFPITKSHYEWTHLTDGEQSDKNQGNRKFIMAYRYTGGN